MNKPDRPFRVTVKTKALKPGFIKAKHLGPVTAKQAKARIDTTAQLMAVQS